MILSLSGIRKDFGALKVLRGIDLEVEKGELVSIMGASGAGKSTLLQVMGTLMTPQDGTLEVDGAKVFDSGKCLLSPGKLSRFRCGKIGFVFQSHHLLPEFSSLENVMLPALINGVGKAQAAKEAAALLERVGLSQRMEHKNSELSGGEQQRVAIARALINKPAILLADEPTGSLDCATKDSIHTLLLDLRKDLGQTMVLVTHDEALAGLCERTIRLRDGQIEKSAL